LSGELEPEAPQNAEKASVFSSLSLTEVRYQYEGSDGERFTLGPLSLHFRPGELVFLVGGNGSGKTTFANLLVGLYPPDSGEISLNGEPIGPDRQEMYRQQFSVVFSDFFLFGDVAFASARTPQEVDKLLRLLRLDHKVSFRDGRFSTTSLSQGQRKRLALLQAWIEQRPFYVFDEWAADQDPEFKEVFYRELLPALKAEGKPFWRSPTMTAIFIWPIALLSWKKGDRFPHTRRRSAATPPVRCVRHPPQKHSPARVLF
jgi:putative ATP-binding cassette transporter